MAVSTLIYDAYRDYSSKRSALLVDPEHHAPVIVARLPHSTLISCQEFCLLWRLSSFLLISIAFPS
jgi:hypothetical protein